MSGETSPFKFLDPYGEDDTAIFFGREQEEEQLYHLIKKNRLVLAYGPSGSGKTSLVQCGLARQFERSEWMPKFIRRGDDINVALVTELGIVPTQPLDEQEVITLSQLVVRQLREIRKDDLRPIYLIFDQFEELLILGSEQEQEKFKTILKALLDHYSDLSCNIILLMREEYFARLDTFEKDVPGISDIRMRVEPIRLEEAKDIVKKSCTHFRITLEEPDGNAEQIIDAIAGKREISLPYLQVYLDQLWRMDYQRTWPDGYTGEGIAPLEFTTDEIRSFGKIKQVLDRFLQEQKDEIQVQLKTAFPQAPENCVSDLLDCFVTYDGTKLPVPYTKGEGHYRLRKKAPEYLRQLHPEILKYVLDKLDDNRILRNDGSCFELAHDTLARLVDKQRNAHQRRLNDFRQQLEAANKGFGLTKEYLTFREVKAYEEFVPQLDLSQELVRFFRESKAYREREEHKRLVNSRWYRRLKALNVLVFLMLFIVVAIGFFFVRQTNTSYAQLYMAYTIETIPDKTDALILAKYIYDHVRNAGAREQINSKIKDLVLAQPFQSVFSSVLTKKWFLPGDVDISRDGQYIMVKDGEVKLLQQGKKPKSMGRCIYAYFLNNSDTLLLAKNSGQQGISGSAASAYPVSAYPDEFTLYDCRRDTILFAKTFDPGEFLFEAQDIFPTVMYNPLANYRVQYTAGGNLLVPHWNSKTNMRLASHVQVVSPSSKILADHPSASTVGISKQGTEFMTLEYKGSMPVVHIFDERGQLKYDLPGQGNFTDFTEKGSLIYFDNGYLHRRRDHPFRQDSFPAGPLINYAYANGDETYAIGVGAKDTTCIIDLSNGRKWSSPGKLVGRNFSTKSLVMRSVTHGPDTVSHPDTLWSRDFSGAVLGSFVCPEGIESAVYNAPSECTLVLAKNAAGSTAQYLYLLNKQLQIRASFGLTANDRYGFSRDGSRLYWVRDNILGVFDNSAMMVNFTDPNVVKHWLDTSRGYSVGKAELKEKREKYKLRFPGEGLGVF